MGLVVSALASKTRQQAIKAREREEQASILYRLSKDLASSDSLEAVLHTIRMNVGGIFDCRVAVFLPADHKIKPGSFDTGFPIDEHENTIAAWVFGNGKSAGWGTDTLPAAKAHYLPLKTIKRAASNSSKSLAIRGCPANWTNMGYPWNPISRNIRHAR